MVKTLRVQVLIIFTDQMESQMNFSKLSKIIAAGVFIFSSSQVWCMKNDNGEKGGPDFKDLLAKYYEMNNLGIKCIKCLEISWANGNATNRNNDKESFVRSMQEHRKLLGELAYLVWQAGSARKVG